MKTNKQTRHRASHNKLEHFLSTCVSITPRTAKNLFTQKKQQTTTANKNKTKQKNGHENAQKLKKNPTTPKYEN